MSATASTSSTTNKVTYAVGDFVYFDDQSATDAPFQIRKIDELVKTEKGSVDARCVVYLRRRDIPQHLLKIADQAQRRFDNYYEVDKKKPENFTPKGFVVANGAPANSSSQSTANEDVKEEETEDDGPPKIDQEEGVAAAPINAGRTGSSADSEEDASLKEKAEAESTKLVDWGDGGLPLGVEKLTKDQRLRLRQHEIFMTRQSEILPATLIRGKCRVVLLGDGEEASNYLPHEDTFYHSLVYDPNAQTLLADKGAIRVGEKYQAVVEDWMEPEERERRELEEREARELAAKVKREQEEERARQEKEDEEMENGLKIDEGDEEMEVKEEEKVVVKKEEVEEPNRETREVLVWTPYHNLTDREIDQYLIVARSVGLFARAIDGASAPKLPTLQLAAAFASRDVTILHAHAILHQSNYDVGQAVKYLVPIANKETYPMEVDETTGLHTKSLGGPILCRDQLEEWSTPEMNLFEDALDKCGKDFNEIRADYLPWKSIRDIVEYYYLMKASNRYTDRKKAKPSATSSDEKFTNIYIPPFNKAISASVLPYNTTPTLVRSEIPCENCGTLDGQNWYHWGGVEKKVLCNACWIKWKKFAGLDQKHELERFDKTRPPVLDQQPALLSNGGDRPPVLQQQKPTNLAGDAGGRQILGTPQQRAAAQLLTFKTANNGLGSVSKQNLMNVAKEALARGQITQEQFIQLNKNFALTMAAQQQQTTAHQQQQMQQQHQFVQQHAQAQAQAQTAQSAGATGPQKRKVTPATKPTIFFYTTICRRAVRRVLPKSVFNLRKLSRNLRSAIDEEKILKFLIVQDKKTLLNAANSAAGENRNLIVESDFHKGITHLQHTLTSAATGKRTVTQTPTTSSGHPGEPAAKMAKLSLFSPSPSSSSFDAFTPPLPPQQHQHRFSRPRPPVRAMVTPSLEDIGNTLLAVRKSGVLSQGSLTQGASTPSSSSEPRTATNTNLSVRERMKILRRTRTDSRWFETTDDVVKLRCGPQLKSKRRQLMSRRDQRRVARNPCKFHQFLLPHHTIISPIFLEEVKRPGAPRK